MYFENDLTNDDPSYAIVFRFCYRDEGYTQLRSMQISTVGDT